MEPAWRSAADDIAVLVHRRDHLLMLDGFRSDTLDPELDLIVRLRATPPRRAAAEYGAAHTGSGRVDSRGDQLADARPAPRLRASRPARAGRCVGGRRSCARPRGLAPPAGVDPSAAAVMTPGMEALAYLLLVLAIVARGPGDPVVRAHPARTAGLRASPLALGGGAGDGVHAARRVAARRGAPLCRRGGGAAGVAAVRDVEPASCDASRAVRRRERARAGARAPDGRRRTTGGGRRGERAR